MITKISPVIVSVLYSRVACWVKPQVCFPKCACDSIISLIFPSETLISLPSPLFWYHRLPQHLLESYAIHSKRMWEQQCSHVGLEMFLKFFKR